MTKPKKPDLNSQGSQAGVTLLVSVVLLAVVTFISFSISTIIIREIQGSRLTLKTEPAISAANSGGEVGLYRFFRSQPPVNTTGTLSGSGGSYVVDAELYVNQYSFVIDPGPAEVAVKALYIVDDLNKTTGNYDSVTITLKSNSAPADFRIISWSDPGTNIHSGPLFAGQVHGPFLLNAPDDRYVIYILPPSSGTSKVRGDIEAAPLGVPSDSPKLDITGTNGTVQRRIEINL